MASPFTVLAGTKISATSPANLIMIEYDPEKSKKIPFGEKIVLVQLVSMDVDGNLFLPSEYYTAAAGFGWEDANCLTGATTRGTSIDAMQNEPQPFYNDSFGTNAPSETARPSWAVGQISYTGLKDRSMSVAVDLSGSFNTLRYAKTMVSRSTDKPGDSGGKKGYYHKTNNPGGWKTFTLTFQVFAYCSKGLDAGLWYEGIAWKYTKTSDDAANGKPGTSVYVGELDGPDKDFLDAFNLFNKKRVDADGTIKPEFKPPVPT
jgi:hypothetical protein